MVVVVIMELSVANKWAITVGLLALQSRFRKEYLVIILLSSIKCAVGIGVASSVAYNKFFKQGDQQTTPLLLKTLLNHGYNGLQWPDDLVILNTDQNKKLSRFASWLQQNFILQAKNSKETAALYGNIYFNSY